MINISQNIVQRNSIWLLLSCIVMAAGSMLIIYRTYLPVITQFLVHKEDRQALDLSYRVAKVGFIISGLSGFVIGLCLLPAYRLCRRKGTSTYPNAPGNSR